MNNNSDIDLSVKIKVLNQLFAAQTMLHIFPDETKMGEFITQALNAIPGIEECIFCSRNCEFVPSTSSPEIKTILEYIKNIPDEQDHFSISLPEKYNRLVISLLTAERSYGYVFISIENSGYLENYIPAINNFINMVAMELEKRWQKTQLIKHRFHLEEMVEKRTIELQKEITGRKQVENVLKQTHESLTNTLESMTDGFVSLDKNWIYTYVNNKAGEMFGRKPADLVGKHIWTEFPEGIDQPFYKNYYKAVETQKIIIFEDYYLLWDRWFENRVIPFKAGLAIFFQDITERKKSKEELEKHRNHLEEIVKERTQQLEDKNKALDRMNKLFVGRELRMKELKKEIDQLNDQIKKK